MSRKLVFAVALVACFALVSSASAQTFDLALDAPLLGTAGNKELAVGAGFSLGLVHAGPIRVGVGVGGVYYPNRSPGDIIDTSCYACVGEDRYTDRGDLVFYVPFGFRLVNPDKVQGTPALYFSVLYMRVVTKSEVPPHGNINNGVLMGLTFSSK